MTDSFMRCCGKLFSTLLFGLTLFTSFAGQAADISVRNPNLSVAEDGYTLAADFNINLNSRLDEAIAKGITLYFVVDFELTRSRWYWPRASTARPAGGSSCTSRCRCSGRC